MMRISNCSRNVMTSTFVTENKATLPFNSSRASVSKSIWFIYTCGIILSWVKISSLKFQSQNMVFPCPQITAINCCDLTPSRIKYIGYWINTCWIFCIWIFWKFSIWIDELRIWYCLNCGSQIVIGAMQFCGNLAIYLILIFCVGLYINPLCVENLQDMQ